MKRIYEKSKCQACGRSDNRGFPTPESASAQMMVIPVTGVFQPRQTKSIPIAGVFQPRKLRQPAAGFQAGFKLPSAIVAFLFILAITIMTPPALKAQAQNPAQNPPQDPAQAQGPVIATPVAFVEKNLNDFKERLGILKARYENQFGSLFAATSPVEYEAIAKEFPKPATLTLLFRYPLVKLKKEESASVMEKGEYFVKSFDTRVGIAPLDYATGIYFPDSNNNQSKDGAGGLVAADLITTQLLGIPQKVAIDLSANRVLVSSERSRPGYPICCKKVGKCTENWCVQNKVAETCLEYANIPKITDNVHWPDPRDIESQLNVIVEPGEGVTVENSMRDLVFTSPGRKDIKFSSNRKWSNEEPYNIYENCIPNIAHPYLPTDQTKVLSGYKPAGVISTDFHFTAVAFKKFGFPGYEIDASYGKMPDLDYFYAPRSIAYKPSDWYNYWGEFASDHPPLPLILLDYGNAGGLKAVKASDIGAPITWSTTLPGPFHLEVIGRYAQIGTVYYRGGIGATKFRATLGGLESVEHSITANEIQVVPDADMARGKVSAGKEHKVLIQVKGPADLGRYQVKWTGEGGAWTQPVTPFAKVGDAWQAEGKFTVPFAGTFDPANLGKPVKIAGEMIRTADSVKIYSYENSRLAVSYPAIDKLELYVGINDREPQKVTAPVDIFLSTEVPKATLLPMLVLQGGKAYKMNEIKPGAPMAVISSNPAVALITQEGGKPGVGGKVGPNVIVASPGARPGTSTVTARLGGGDIDPNELAQFTGEQKELTSAPVTINVNNVFVITSAGSGGKIVYTLKVAGPSDMSSYRAQWTGGAMLTEPFKNDAGVFVSAVEAAPLMFNKAAIVKDGVVMAEVNVTMTAVNMNIRIIPPTPPVTTVTKAAVSDTGSLETLTECKKAVNLRVANSGFNPGMSVEDYCSAQRAQDKKDIPAQRADQQAFNDLLSNLNSQGQELVIMSDTMQVGAAIRGDLTALGDKPFCYWTLEKGGALKLENEITPVDVISPQEGGCFNIMKGLKGGFNPDTSLKVDLIVLAKPAVPIFTSSGKVVIDGAALSR